MAFPGSFVVAQDCTGRRGRRPLQMNKQIAIIVRCFGGGKPPLYSTNGKGSVGANSVRPCSLVAARDPAGERCSHRPAKPPLCKGRWHGVSRDGGIGACTGVLGCTHKVTIPQSASLTPLTRPSPSVAARHLPTLWGVTLDTREPPSTPVEFIWPRRGQSEKK